MLAVQVQYWGLQEEKRHNLAVEEETNRHNVVVENETNRHNVQTEMLGWASLAETTRHNMATEAIARDQLDEVARHNRETERIAWSNVGIAQGELRVHEYNAATQRLEYDLHKYQTALNEQKINNDFSLGLEANRIAEMNAETNQQRMINDAAIGWSNMDVQHSLLEVKRGELELSQRKLKYDVVLNSWSNFNNTLRSGTGVAALAAGM